MWNLKFPSLGGVTEGRGGSSSLIMLNYEILQCFKNIVDMLLYIQIVTSYSNLTYKIVQSIL
jgi:hypothetical protein